MKAHYLLRQGTRCMHPISWNSYGRGCTTQMRSKSRTSFELYAIRDRKLSYRVDLWLLELSSRLISLSEPLNLLASQAKFVFPRSALKRVRMHDFAIVNSCKSPLSKTSRILSFYTPLKARHAGLRASDYFTRIYYIYSFSFSPSSPREDSGKESMTVPSVTTPRLDDFVFPCLPNINNTNDAIE